MATRNLCSHAHTYTYITHISKRKRDRDHTQHSPNGGRYLGKRKGNNKKIFHRCRQDRSFAVCFVEKGQGSSAHQESNDFLSFFIYLLAWLSLPSPINKKWVGWGRTPRAPLVPSPSRKRTTYFPKMHPLIRYLERLRVERSYFIDKRIVHSIS